MRGMACALAGILFLGACSSEEGGLPSTEAGKGLLRLGLSAETGFRTTKAVNESDYRDTGKYTVQIYKQQQSGDALVSSYTGATLPTDLIELSDGSYRVKAFYGEDKPASTSSMYVEGNEYFDIQSDKVSDVRVTCAPVCARVKFVFEGMTTYFKDWQAIIDTEALGESSFIYKKEYTDPLYLRVKEGGEQVKVTFRITNSADKISEINRTYTMSPNRAMAITVKPAAAQNGNLGISISIDGTTNDRPIDIEIPSDWL